MLLLSNLDRDALHQLLRGGAYGPVRWDSNLRTFIMDESIFDQALKAIYETSAILANTRFNTTTTTNNNNNSSSSNNNISLGPTITQTQNSGNEKETVWQSIRYVYEYIYIYIYICMYVHMHTCRFIRVNRYRYRYICVCIGRLF